MPADGQLFHSERRRTVTAQKLQIVSYAVHLQKQILDIAERGRSFGIILFSAQQFLSAAHPRVTGNAATKVLGRTDSAEINQANYRFLEQDIKMHLTRLNQGEMILSHPIYRQPVKIRFPRNPYRQTR